MIIFISYDLAFINENFIESTKSIEFMIIVLLRFQKAVIIVKFRAATDTRNNPRTEGRVVWVRFGSIIPDFYSGLLLRNS
jgi:hypothetical protein